MPTETKLEQLRWHFRAMRKWSEREAFIKSLKGQLPAGLEPKYAKKMFEAVWHSMLHEKWNWLVTAENVAIAREVFRGSKNQRALWVGCAVDEGCTAEDLHAALDAFKRLCTPTYAQTPEGVTATLKHPKWVEATRAALAATYDEWNFSKPMVALLFAEGSPESADVLMPMAMKALAEKSTALDQLRALCDQYAAKTPAMQALKAQLVAVSNSRADESGANAFAAKLGLEARNDFEARLQLNGNRKNGAKIFEVSVSIDAKDAEWGRVTLYWQRATGRLASMDEWSSLRGDRPNRFQPLRALDRLPAWLAEIAKKRHCTFKVTQLKANLSAADQTTLRAWLKQQG